MITFLGYALVIFVGLYILIAMIMYIGFIFSSLKKKKDDKPFLLFASSLMRRLAVSLSTFGFCASFCGHLAVLEYFIS